MKLKLSSRTPNLTLLIMLLVAALCLFAPDVMAQTEAQTKLCGVMGNVYSILKVASILIVTIAIIFAGYQIAFAHKRISDVAPILIGGLLIGAAAQIASMMIGNSAEKTGGDCSTAFHVIQADPIYRA